MPAETAYQLVHDELQVCQQDLNTPVLTNVSYVFPGRRFNQLESGYFCDDVYGTASGKADDGDLGKEHH